MSKTEVLLPGEKPQVKTPKNSDAGTNEINNSPENNLQEEEEESFEYFPEKKKEDKYSFKSRRSTRAEETEFEMIDRIRKEIAVAITSKNFKKSKQLNIELDKHIESIFVSRLNNELQKFNENVNNVIDVYLQEVRRLKKSTTFMLEPIRIQEDESFEALKANHLQLLTELETERQFEYMKNKDFKSGEEIHLEAMAQNLAKLKRYDEAQMLQKNADQLHKKNLNDKTQVTNRKFDVKEKKLFDRFRVDLNNLKDKSNKAEETVRTQIKELISLEEKKLNVKCKDLLKQSANNVSYGDGITDNISRERRVHTHTTLFNSLRKIIMERKLESVVNISN
ncbi:hypothetical protein TVAG_093770 [Trichomonas vaginalis G3]|uniref:Uncharacterized protein n=1 Tax=Trichomonas vaginalis (strain ATCC PRA-98 / G3) TaxID=412133 RepID=A2DBK0_TRIV3|nr:hypothetical protein TVAGG3_0381970 [Trichomonas vaginalis G3]EAY22203.1 hypothetical protein TVAG_093770 [Trichomonas vaginalis G3]KAI5533339.1 hypothetical protein TVAGG3_0381970 [Trichomonas vaginalis G3]|eukprot:XP_001583189.1 hypothetical protein [Trichomonas vaginalis G3]